MIKNCTIFALIGTIIWLSQCNDCTTPDPLPVKEYNETVEYDNGTLELDFRVQGELIEWLIDVPECPTFKPKSTTFIYKTDTVHSTIVERVMERDTIVNVVYQRQEPRKYTETVDTDNGPATLEILIAGNHLLSWSIELPEVINQYFPNIDTIDIIDKNNRWFVSASGGSSFTHKRAYAGAGAGFINGKNIAGLSINYDGRGPYFLINYSRILR